ncbi:hypothetical protein CCACVL1_02321 [Corchorus capsularis]|uniref:Uncharacterized protein n=1 Tax=Corchorus capsularis TaxID=210143 RepID=A0A1R3K979_COCAP|nr:hypothetical protein CCACVL1_02321 [Corchorus capsularis]
MCRPPHRSTKLTKCVDRHVARQADEMCRPPRPSTKLTKCVDRHVTRQS